MGKLGMALLTSGAVLLSAAVSNAQSAPASIYLSGTTLRHVANDGQTNVVTIRASNSSITVRDTAGLTAGAGCTQSDPMEVSCEIPNSFVLDLKDGDDIVNNHASITMYAYGGPGNDTLEGGPALDGLFGADGDDILNSNGGNDIVSGGVGNDTINTGEGNDRIDDDDGDDIINAGSGDDRIADYGGVDTINAGAGDDTIFSLDDIADTINCGAGSDSYSTNPTDIRSSCENPLN